MNTVRIKVGDGYQGVTIGIRAENLANEVVFDVTALRETYGDGTAVLMVKRSRDTDAYPATVTQDGDTVTWVPTAADLAYQGAGECELFWYVGELLAKSIVYRAQVQRDIGEATGTPPDPYETWVETLTELGAETLSNAQRAEAAATSASADADTASAAAEQTGQDVQAAQQAAASASSAAETATEASETATDAATSASTSATAAATSASAAEISATQAGLSATSAAASATSAAQSADRAEQAAATAGYIDVDIVDGRLIYTRTDAVDVDFDLVQGRLIMEAV